MGASRSKTEVNKMMDIASKVLNETVQSNTSTIQQTQGIYIKETKGDINISNLDWSQYAQINTTALASSQVNNQVDTKLKEMLTAQAEAISGSLSLSLNDSQTLTNATTKLSNEIANKFTQECKQQASQTQEIVIGSVGGNVDITAINWKQYTKQVIESTLNSVADSKSVMDIESIIDASSRAEGKGLLDGPMLFIILIICVIGFVMYKTASGGTAAVTEMLTNKWFWMGVISLIGGYMVFAYLGSLWPFTPPKDEKNKFCGMYRKNGFTGCCSPTLLSFTRPKRSCSQSGGCGYNLMSRYQENFLSYPKKDHCCGKYKVPQPMMEKCCGEYNYHAGEPGNILPSWT